MYLWSHDLVQQCNTQINILTVPETHISGKDIMRCYTQRSPVIQAIQEHKATSKPLEVSVSLPLKWLTEKPRHVKQWPLTEDKVQALEQLIQKQLDAHRIEESTIPLNSFVFVFKKKSDKWRMVTDLRAVNKAIQPICPLQSGIPLPSL